MVEREQSEFNSAVSYLNRLNSIINVIVVARMSLDANGWYHALISLFAELSTEMTKKDERSIMKRRLDEEQETNDD